MLTTQKTLMIEYHRLCLVLNCYTEYLFQLTLDLRNLNMQPRHLAYLQSAATMVTTMDVVVDELCNNTVARMPIIKLETGLLRMALLEKALPAALPATEMLFSKLKLSKFGHLSYRKYGPESVICRHKLGVMNFPDISCRWHNYIYDDVEKHGILQMELHV